MEKKTLELLCKVNQLSFTEEEKDAFLSFMDERDADIKALDAIDTENVEIMVHVMPIMTVVREDKEIKNFTRDQLQEGAPTVDAADIPDLVPILSIVAGAKNGAVFTNIQRLRIKESDRVASTIAMVEALGDRWSYYMSVEEYVNYTEKMSNSYVGIGITIQVREDGTGLNIMKVTAGGPAEAAGVLAGDVLIGVEGQSIAGLSTSEVKKEIKGDAGTEVIISQIR